MNKFRIRTRLTATLLAVMLGITGSFSIAFADSTASAGAESGDTVTTEDTAENQDPTEGTDDMVTEETVNPYNITEVTMPDNAVLKQTITAYSGTKPTLPATLAVRTEGSEAAADIAVQWKCNKTYNNKKAGTYTYTCMVPEEYTLAEGVTLPEITVTVKKCTTKINGAAKTLTKKSRGTLYDTVTVYNGYGSVLKVQMYTGGKWVTKKKITLKNTGKQTIKVQFPNNWWKVTTSKWRMVIAANQGKTGVTTKTCTVKTLRYYQNPSKYVQIQDNITIDNSGGYTLKSGYMGLKVRKVNNYFGIGSKLWPRYTSTTKAKVRAFQSRNGLKVTGNVNKATWLKMGFSEKSWYNLGAYVSPVQVNPSSTKADHIEAMIDRAYDYLGEDYVVGASGTPSQGADCSGIVMQALYAAGVEMEGINPVTHSWAGHEFESRNIWNNADFKKVSYSSKKRGDLIFYRGPSGYVTSPFIWAAARSSNLTLTKCELQV